jgi:nucleoside phosphorylase
MAAAKAMLDEIHEDLPVPPNNHNAYTLGRIRGLNIVIACLPNSEYGIASAATVAVQLLASFYSVRFGLMVGIGGGVLNMNADVHLGDIVVSKPTATYRGVVQYDYGKAVVGGFE